MKAPHTRCWRNGTLDDEGFPVEQVSEHLDEPDTLVWVDLCSPDHKDLELVANELSLHELAVEDATTGSNRPKLDHYSTHEFLTAYQVDLDLESGELATHEIAAFITKNALVTVRPDEGFDIKGLAKRWDDNEDLTKHGIGGLVYGLVDFIVDGHFHAVEALDGQIEGLEDLLFDGKQHDADVQRRSFELRKSLVLLRRVVTPMREVVNSLMRRDVGMVNDETLPYYQDVYDHVLRVSEWTESLRDLVSTIRETSLTIQSNRLNVITKKVTSWAAIVAVPTAITGFYGQNVPYPGFGQSWGFWASTVLILAGTVGLYFTFRRKDWL